MNIKTIISTIKSQINAIKKNINLNKNIKYIILLVILFCIIYLFYYSIKKESYQNYSKRPHHLTNKSINKFLMMQKTMNPEINFDIEKLKYQVTQKELNYYLRHGHWHWSQEVIDLYKNAVSKNTLIRKNPHESIKYARSIYNENAILEVISMQTKEGNFLTNGIIIHNKKPNNLEDLPSGFGTFGYDSGLIQPKNDIIKCKIDPYGNNSHLEKIHFTGKGGIFGEQNKKITPINYRNLEHEIPGFKFIKTPCNPCKVFDSPSNYSCPYELNIPNENPGISSIWKHLWFSNF